MKFEEANDILLRRYQYHMATIPTDDEVKEAEKAFGAKFDGLISCFGCTHFKRCNMKSLYRTNCNFFTEATR